MIKHILFNTDMVRAILTDRKTVTRRVVKLKYSNTHLEMRTDKYGTRLIELQNEEPGVTTVKNPNGTTTHRLLAYIEKAPPYHPGDILYVRETWQYTRNRYIYKVDTAGILDDVAYHLLKWRPSIHMPREAARIFLRATDVQVERLQEITEEQATAEGCEAYSPDESGYWEPATLDFVDTWNSTIKPADCALYGWDANPWVWVIAFERISREEEGTP